MKLGLDRPKIRTPQETPVILRQVRVVSTILQIK